MEDFRQSPGFQSGIEVANRAVQLQDMRYWKMQEQQLQGTCDGTPKRRRVSKPAAKHVSASDQLNNNRSIVGATPENDQFHLDCESNTELLNCELDELEFKTNDNDNCTANKPILKTSTYDNNQVPCKNCEGSQGSYEPKLVSRKRSFDSDSPGTPSSCSLNGLSLSAPVSKGSSSSGIACEEAVMRYASHLTEFERCEALTFPEIYYMGPLSRVPIHCIRPPPPNVASLIPSTAPSWSAADVLQMRRYFSDSAGDYKFALLGQHLGYRYEMLRWVGSGSFGKVMECLDHKTGKHVAVKVIKNQDRFLMQARYEMYVLRRINQQIFSRFGPRSVVDCEPSAMQPSCMKEESALRHEEQGGEVHECKDDDGDETNEFQINSNVSDNSSHKVENFQHESKDEEETDIKSNSDARNTNKKWNMDPDSIPIVQMKNAMFFRGHVLFAFDMMSMNLFELILHNKHLGFSLPLVRRIGRQIFYGLSLLERCGIIHCDLKPENIMVCDPSTSDRVKIIDFGSSCTNSSRIHTYIQSRFYRAPEVMLRMPYSCAIDTWSAACTLAELYTGMPLFAGKNEADQLFRISHGIGNPSREYLNMSPVKGKYFDDRCRPLMPQVTTSHSNNLAFNNVAPEPTPLPKKLTDLLHPRASYRTMLPSQPQPCLPGPRNAMKGELEAFEAMLRGCLEWNPAKRTRPHQVLQSEFFSGTFDDMGTEEARLHDATVSWEEITRCLSTVANQRTTVQR